MVIKLFMAISFSQWPASGSSGDIVSGSAARFEDGGLVKTQKISGNTADHQGGASSVHTVLKNCYITYL